MSSRTGCCKCLVNVEKLDPTTGSVLWRSSKLQAAHGSPGSAAEIRALSDNSLVASMLAPPTAPANSIVLQRLSADGTTVIATVTCPGNVDLGFPRIQVGPGASGSADINDYIYVASTSGGVQCFDALFNLLWTISINTATILCVGSSLYVLNYHDSYVKTYNALTGSLVSTSSQLLYGGSPVFGKLQAVNGTQWIVWANSLLGFPAGGGTATSGGGGTSTSANHPMAILDASGNVYLSSAATGQFSEGFTPVWSGSLGGGVATWIQQLLDGAFVVAGTHFNLNGCLANVVCFNSGGTIRWLNSQSDECQTGATIGSQVPFYETFLTCGKSGLTVCPDGGVVVTSPPFPCGAKASCCAGTSSFSSLLVSGVRRWVLTSVSCASGSPCVTADPATSASSVPLGSVTNVNCVVPTCGSASFTWSGSAWVSTSSTCTGGCSAGSPTGFVGSTVGQTVTIACAPS